MAIDYSKFATLTINLNRQQYAPLDVSSVFNSTADLTYYRTKGQTKLEGLSDYWKDIVPYPYEGQIVSLTENGEVSVFKLVANGDVFDVVAIGDGSDLTDISADNVTYKEGKLSDYMFVALTQAEYDALVESGEMNENTPYLILDGEGA